PPGGSIILLAEQRGRRARWSISDTGAGIDPKHLPYVFDRFYRADSSRGAGQGGSGLGLSIAQALVAGQGGAISVDSVPGRGTTVILDLPAAPATQRISRGT
ncbi:MAG TPA: HAMP domain-containing sensor histidine kinase, partial [Herpetosiphonaceae bacterium]|nr:HAMP domain-containing sensor histidine kinase [Herpetosiphonaceae bacterium]